MHLTTQFNIEVKPSTIVNSHKPKLQNPTGVYYDKLEDASKNVKIYNLMALDDMFLDKEIVAFVCHLFDVTADYTQWEDFIKACAWKCKAVAKSIKDKKDNEKDDDSK